MVNKGTSSSKSVTRSTEPVTQVTIPGDNIVCIKTYPLVVIFSCLHLFALFPRSELLEQASIPGYGGGGRGSGGEVSLQGNRWFSPPASMTSHLASVTFKMASKVFIEERDKFFFSA